MARIELSNAGGGGGGGTLTLTTTGTSGASTLVGTALNIPVYQGQLTLSTAGTSGASTLVGNTLTIPTYQGQVSLTTTGTSGASTFVGNTLNVPQYQGALTLTTTGSGAATLVGTTLNIPTPVATTPGGSNTDIQYNNSGAFGGSSNLQWDNANVRLNIGAPSSPTGRLNVKGSGLLTTVNTRLTNSGDTELVKVLDNGSTNIGTKFAWDNANARLGIGTLTPSYPFNIVTDTNVNLAQGIFRIDRGSGYFSLNPGTTGGGFYPGIEARPQVGDNYCIEFRSVHPSTAFANCGVVFASRRNDNNGPIGNGQIIAYFVNYTTPYFGIFGNGNTVLRNGGTFTDNGERLQVYGNILARGDSPTTGSVFRVQNSTPDNICNIENNGKITYWATNTAAGTTGAQTINKPSGTVNFAAGATSLVVTNSLCTTSSIVLPVVRTNDATATIKNVVPGTGSFTINLEAAATAETSVGFFIIN